jgi:hypothetical protein
MRPTYRQVRPVTVSILKTSFSEEVNDGESWFKVSTVTGTSWYRPAGPTGSSGLFRAQCDYACNASVKYTGDVLDSAGDREKHGDACDFLVFGELDVISFSERLNAVVVQILQKRRLRRCQSTNIDRIVANSRLEWMPEKLASEVAACLI